MSLSEEEAALSDREQEQEVESFFFVQGTQ